MDSRAVDRLDVGFSVGIVLWPHTKGLIEDPCPLFGLPRNLDRSSYTSCMGFQGRSGDDVL